MSTDSESRHDRTWTSPIMQRRRDPKSNQIKSIQNTSSKERWNKNQCIISSREDNSMIPTITMAYIIRVGHDNGVKIANSDRP